MTFPNGIHFCSDSRKFMYLTTLNSKAFSACELKPRSVCHVLCDSKGIVGLEISILHQNILFF